MVNNNIGVILGKSTAVLQSYRPSGSLFEKKSFQIWSRGVHVPKFRTLSFFVWPEGETQTHTHINDQT